MIKLTDTSPKASHPNHKIWKTNHAIIKECVLRVIEESKGTVIPTVSMVAKLVNMSEPTVKKHLRNLKFEPSHHPLRVLTDEVLYNIYLNSKTSSRAAELWLKVMEGWSDTFNLKIQEIPLIVMKRADENREEGS